MCHQWVDYDIFPHIWVMECHPRYGSYIYINCNILYASLSAYQPSSVRAHTHTHTHTRARARARAHTHIHVYTNIKSKLGIIIELMISTCPDSSDGQGPRGPLQQIYSALRSTEIHSQNKKCRVRKKGTQALFAKLHTHTHTHTKHPLQGRNY